MHFVANQTSNNVILAVHALTPGEGERRACVSCVIIQYIAWHLALMRVQYSIAALMRYAYYILIIE